MKICKIQSGLRIAVIFQGLLCGLIFISGCHSVPMPGDLDHYSVRLSPLTTFIPASGADGHTELKVVAELLDAAGVSIQHPCTFRFELYEFKPLSSQPRGERLALWPDISLDTDVENDPYWKGYLKGYEFLLPLDFAPQKNTKYVLEGTCMFEQRRYADIIMIEF